MKEKFTLTDADVQELLAIIDQELMKEISKELNKVKIETKQTPRKEDTFYLESQFIPMGANAITMGVLNADTIKAGKINYNLSAVPLEELEKELAMRNKKKKQDAVKTLKQDILNAINKAAKSDVEFRIYGDKFNVDMLISEDEYLDYDCNEVEFGF